MNCPKIPQAKAINHHVLAIEFTNGEKKWYDVSALLKNKRFLPLKNPGFFRNEQVEASGYAVFWSEEIDISEYELWTHGKDSIDQAIAGT